MRRVLFALVCGFVVVSAGNANADIGLFTSYSTTAMRAPGAMSLNVSVGTTGYVTTYPTDYVVVLAGVLPTTGTTFTGTGGSTVLPRTGVGANAFSGSFSITGLSDTTNYKWVTLAFGDVGGIGFGFTAFYYVYYFLYYGCLPFATTAPLVITTPANPGVPQPVACTTTPTGGPLYDFVNSNVNTLQSTANWWVAYGPTLYYPLFAHGAAGGLAAVSNIPTLASWGLMVLGTLIALTGVILSRRI